MWTKYLVGIDSATRLTGSAVLCAVWTQSQSSRQNDAWAELLCWVLLLILCKLSSLPVVQPKSKSHDGFSSATSRHAYFSLSLWLFAICIAIKVVCDTEQGSNSLFPLLMPLLLITDPNQAYDTSPPTFSSALSPSTLANTVWGTTFTALFGIATVIDFSLSGLGLSLVSAAANFIIYSSLLDKPSKIPRYIPHIDIIEDIQPLSLRVIVTLIFALLLKSIILGTTSAQWVSTLVLGASKASTFYFLIQTVYYTTWRIAVPITSFSILSTTNLFFQSSDIKSFSIIFASLLFLVQIVGIIPRCSRSLWALSLIPTIPYFVCVQAIIMSQQLASSSFEHGHVHPVQDIIHAARHDFSSLIQRQSKNYTASHEEYTRRYGLEPLPGFKAWYQFARSNQSPIIDDFDSIQRSIKPLLKLSGREALEAISQVYSQPDSEVWLCEYSSNDSHTKCSHPHRTFDRHISLLFNRIMSDVRNDIQNLKFLVNHFDEPRLLGATQFIENQQSKDTMELEQSKTSIEPSKHIWDRISLACKFPTLEPEATRHRLDHLGLSFVRNHTAEKDICQHPEYEHMHGLLINPSTFRPIENLALILSTGSLSMMGDILFPSPAYIEKEFQYEEGPDVDWDSKQNNLYWAGSTTGGFANDHWRDFHRQRLVDLIQNPSRKHKYSYLKEKNGIVERIVSSFLNGRLYNVAFTRIFQCQRSSCRDQRAHFNMEPWAHKDEALRSRLAFDLDGNGVSGRFYKLLASKSVPLKQTILQEWHDDRLVPWFHYIPVSQSMTELPELVTYLTSTKAGQKQAREIAEHGRDWALKAFREVDLTIYVYRLFLELARLQDPTREASSETFAGN